jgi:hypothetical protein
MTSRLAPAWRRLHDATEDAITTALYRSPDYRHHGPVVLDLAEIFAAIELGYGLDHAEIRAVLARGDRARLRACRAAARVVTAAPLTIRPLVCTNRPRSTLPINADRVRIGCRSARAGSTPMDRSPVPAAISARSPASTHPRLSGAPHVSTPTSRARQRAVLRAVPDPHPDDPGPTEPHLHDRTQLDVHEHAHEPAPPAPVERGHDPHTSASTTPLTSTTSTATSTDAATGGGAAGAGSAAPGRRLVLTPATSITLRPTHWLWTHRIPAGAVVLGPGREGIGKSLFCAWITARVTLGELDGLHHGRPRAVIYAATEDSWERTIAGRLIAAGADMTRVYRVDVHHTGPRGAVVLPLSLPRDCEDLAIAIAAHDVALLVLDPLISAVDSRINVNQEERSASSATPTPPDPRRVTYAPTQTRRHPRPQRRLHDLPRQGRPLARPRHRRRQGRRLTRPPPRRAEDRSGGHHSRPGPGA